MSSNQYKIEFAKCCELAADYNRKAADLADKLADLPRDRDFPREVAEVIKYDELYRQQLARRKYIQENRMLPADDPVKAPRKDYEVPKAGVDMALARGSLAKNVSVWKKRINDPRYPEAEQKHAMYVALYQEAKTAAASERARIQILANESDY